MNAGLLVWLVIDVVGLALYVAWLAWKDHQHAKQCLAQFDALVDSLELKREARDARSAKYAADYRDSHTRKDDGKMTP